MKLSIITINYNNAEGLRKTLASVAAQTFRDFEHIIVDGGSTDGSVEIIREYADSEAIRLKGYKANKVSETSPNDLISSSPNSLPTQVVRWISEKDKGIYNAMNKGIAMAQGEYLQFLNSGDWLVDENVLQNVINEKLTEDIIYGNSILIWPDGRVKKAEYACTVTGKTLYNHTIPHQASYIKKSLFATIGNYSEDLRFGSDWEFFLKALFYHNSSFRYIDVDVCLFDMTGISTDASLSQAMLDERKYVLKRIIPQLYEDYEEMNENAHRLETIDEKALRLGKKILYPYRKIKKNLRI